MMCDFCIQHGEGKKWYLQAKNYAEDLLSDARRQQFIRDFFRDDGEPLRRDLRQLERLAGMPSIVRRLVGSLATRQQKRWHFGQVVPIEDVAKILELVNQVVRVACVCRHVTRGQEARYCFGLTLSPSIEPLAELVGETFTHGPDGTELEVMEKAEALQFMRDAERDGLLHSVWTFVTPFIGGVCNCDRADCIAMRATVGVGAKVMFRAEYVAQVDWDRCSGCRKCMQVCQFGALGFSAAARRVVVDARVCYGCGICRAVCSQEAMRLVERASVPEVARLW